MGTVQFLLKQTCSHSFPRLAGATMLVVKVLNAQSSDTQLETKHFAPQKGRTSILFIISVDSFALSDVPL